jgi:hypothetical protein
MAAWAAMPRTKKSIELGRTRRMEMKQVVRIRDDDEFET